MRASTLFTIFLGAASTVALAQSTAQSRPRDPQTGGIHSTDTGNAGTATSTTDTAGTISGHVVRYEPGRAIVIRDANDEERTYSLGPGVTVPVDVHVGSYVNLATERNGTNVTRVTTSGAQPMKKSQDYSRPTGMPPTQSTMQGTESATPGSSGPSQLPRTGNTGTTPESTGGAGWVTGTVTAYTPRQSITISMPGGNTLEYKLDSSSAVPGDLAIGRTVRIQSDTGTEGAQRLARHVTYATPTTAPEQKKK